MDFRTHRNWLALSLLYVPAIIVVIFSLLFFAGDADHFLRHIFLTKSHLLKDFAIPYLTPGICGGIALAADGQDQLFTFLTPISLLLSNQYLAFRLAIILYALIFAAGIYQWLAFVPELSPRSRAFAALLAALNGFWVSHLQIGHIAFHGLIYLPWLFWAWEKLTQAPLTRSRALRYFVSIALLFFLLLNSGPIWAQLLLPLAIARILMMVLGGAARPAWRELVGGLGVFFGAGLMALLVSAPRYLSIFMLTVHNFPRKLEVVGVFGGVRYALWSTFRALFDPNVLMQRLEDPHLGQTYEWAAYLGLVSLVAIFFSAKWLPRLWRNPVVGTLGLAALLQFLLTVRPAPWQIIRQWIPIFNGLTYYYRGVILIVFFLVVLAALGLETLARHRSRIVPWLAVALPLLSGLEFFFVYQRAGFFVRDLNPLAAYAGAMPERLLGYDRQANHALQNGLATSDCYNPSIVGYANEFFLTQVDFTQPIFQRVKGDFYNINDVARIFNPQNEKAFYKTKAWPLWPVEKSDQLERFIRFERGYDIPPTLRYAEWASLVAAFLWVGLFFWAVGTWRRNHE